MAGATNYGLADLYPNMGFTTTRITTVPDVADQQAFVDEDEADQHNMIVDGSKTRSIWVSMAIVLGVIVLLSKF